MGTMGTSECDDERPGMGLRALRGERVLLLASTLCSGCQTIGGRGHGRVGWLLAPVDSLLGTAAEMNSREEMVAPSWSFVVRLCYSLVSQLDPNTAWVQAWN